VAEANSLWAAASEDEYCGLHDDGPICIEDDDLGLGDGGGSGVGGGLGIAGIGLGSSSSGGSGGVAGMLGLGERRAG
jgi:hypothetical protein